MAFGFWKIDLLVLQNISYTIQISAFVLEIFVCSQSGDHP
jgi:hypothetical protein